MATEQRRGVGAVADILGGQQKPAEGEDEQLDEQLDDDGEAGAASESEQGAGSEGDDQRGREADDLVVESLSELADTAGIGVDELYQVQVPLGADGETVTIGTLKDDYTERQARESALDVARENFENDMIQRNGELTQLLNLLPQLPPELIEQARQRHAAAVEANRQKMLEVKPEWADDEQYQAAKGQMLDLASTYGFSRAEFDGVNDFRLTKLVWDFVQLKRRVERAENTHAELRQGAADNPPPRRRQSQPGAEGGAARRQEALNERAKHGTTADKTAAVRGILGNLRKKG